ncbi:MAG: thymidine phosphorylase [Candidatus Eremiobacteraeota bacterium]|nr:thymidine phosphorylase [Candidatus Eremiobacteraeota bacterium]
MTPAAAIIDRKARGTENAPEEIAWLIDAYCSGDLDDHAMTAWLRAVMRAGMSIEETAALTDVMAHSGDVLDWSGLRAPLVDKHSTGGVGDDVSLIAVPLAAACGVKVAKLSGAALGHTGGTLDKLGCIPGLRTDLSMAAFERQVAGDVGCAIAQASAELAPADKKLYALRDRTNTVASVPLITASVLSKKIAGGATNLVIDVKAGSSAFMPTVEAAENLARSLLAVGTRLGRRMLVLVTDMDAPLANSVGDTLELAEAIASMQHDVPSRLTEAAVAVAEAMVSLAAASQPHPGAAAGGFVHARVRAALREGTAYDRFAAMVQAQGGDIHRFHAERSPSFEIAASAAGFVEGIDGRTLGAWIAARKKDHGAGAGLKLLKRRGDAVATGERLMQVFGVSSHRPMEGLRDAIRLGAEARAEGPVVLRTLRSSA